jgi:hypothetical protein
MREIPTQIPILSFIINLIMKKELKLRFIGKRCPKPRSASPYKKLAANRSEFFII